MPKKNISEEQIEQTEEQRADRAIGGENKSIRAQVESYREEYMPKCQRALQDFVHPFNLRSEEDNLFFQSFTLIILLCKLFLSFFLATSSFSCYYFKGDDI